MGETEWRDSRRNIEALKWLGFVTAIWVQVIAGNNYTFSNYSQSLKDIMNLNQVQLNNLSVAKDFGKAFGLVAGFASDYLPAWVILLIGSLEGFVGYGTQWLVVSKKVSPLPYWQMCIFLCMGGNSTTWMNTAVLITCMRNFKRNRGPVVGILKGYIGLSTAIFTDLCTALFSGSSSSFLFMLTVIPGVVCITSMFFLRPTPSASNEKEEKEESSNFAIFNAIAIIVAVYLLCFDVTGDHGVLLSRVFAAFLLVLLAAPLIVPVKALIRDRYSALRIQKPDVEKQVTEPLLENTVQPEDAPKEENISKKEVVQENLSRKPLLGEDHTIIQAICKFDFWLLFFAFLCGVGTGMAVINNMGQIGLAMGYSDVSMFVSLISIWGFFGRIASGSISEYFLRKSAIARPVWMAASQVLMVIGYLVMAIGMKGSLYIGSIVVGISYGVRLSVSVPTASELFGLKYYGMIYNFLILNLPIGSFLFSGLLAGILYDIEAAKDASNSLHGFSLKNRLMSRMWLGSSDSDDCIGAHCYRMVFIVMGGVCLLGLVLDVLLSFRTKVLYRNIHESRIKNSLQKESSTQNQCRSSSS